MSEELVERVAKALSSGKAREAIKSILSRPQDWQFSEREAHRIKPYPMGFYADDPNIYWAIGWGHHDPTFPWERWLLRRLLKRATPNNDLPTGNEDQING